MSLRKRLGVLLLLAALLLAACASPSPGETRGLTLWYAAGDPLGPVLERLAADYNRGREKGSLPVALRAFPDEAALAAALESGAVPDLLLCTHALAFSLYERGMLRDPAVPALDCPAWLTARSGSVGHGFYPVGFELPLLCTPEGTDAALGALLESAARQGRETGLPWLGVERLAPLFYQALLDEGTEFTAVAAREAFNESYVNLYNALAGAVFDRGLTLETDLALPCRVESGVALRGRDLSGRAVRALSAGALLAEGRGLAVTSREPRSQRELPRLLRFLLDAERLPAAALEAGLVPAAGSAAPASDPLGAALLGLAGRELHLPDAGSQYYVNRDSFEAELRAALELLH